MKMMMGETWAGFGSMVAGIMFVSAMFQQYFPQYLWDLMQEYGLKVMKMVNPYMDISFYEQSGGGFSRNEAYTAIEAYLSTHSSTQANRLKADINPGNSANLVLNLDNNEEITDYFQGIKLRWTSQVSTLNHSKYTQEKRSFKLSFHKQHRELVIRSYLPHVLQDGNAVVVRNRQRRLYTNNSDRDWDGPWTHVTFQHRSTFRTLAMDPKKKKEIEDDLCTFSSSKDYYANIGKAWKRGYLLYGPPGTGKTSMIAAMANLLNYDIYDLELTAVKNNTELRKLLIETSGKSIIVIEDIDCSLYLTGQRKEEEEKKKTEDKKDGDDNSNRNLKNAEGESEKTNPKSDVTLSGLLNFIDGLWSTCGEERIIVFTTNHVDKLDPALIRSGRMDVHIELSYCCFEGFKIMAMNYLKLDSHPLFDTIRGLLEKTHMTPADVAEKLMPKTIKGDANTSLENLIRALQVAQDKQAKSALDKKLTVEKDKSPFRWYSGVSSKKKGKAANQSLPENES